MEENRDLGIFAFKGGEDDIAFCYMWTCLCDLSFWGKVEVIWRIIFVKPPKRYWEIRKGEPSDE